MNDIVPHAPSTREEFLTVRQLAAILQVSESTVRRLAQKGRIPSIRITPHILRFNLNSVRDALDGTHRTRPRRDAARADDSQLSFENFRAGESD